MSFLGAEDTWNREARLISALRDLWAPLAEASVTLCSLADAQAGRACSDHEFSRLILDEALRGLNSRAYLVLRHLYADGVSPHGAARQLNVDLNTVRVEQAAALEQLARLVWEDPTYQSPPRIRLPIWVVNVTRYVRTGQR